MFTINVKEEEIEDEMAKKFFSQTSTLKDKGLIMIQPYKTVVRKGYINLHERIQNFSIYEDDVWIATYPKCGTRWISEIVRCLKDNMDLEKINSTDLNKCIPYFDFDIVDPFGPVAVGSFDEVDKLERPRIIRTHLSYDMLPRQLLEGKNKIINVYRNPRDVCISFLNHMRIIDNYTGDLDTFVDIFLKGFVPYGNMFEHVFSYWNRKEELSSNLLIVSYEEMQADLSSVIKKVANFLDVTISDESILKLCDHVSFKNMKANPMVNCEELINGLKKMLKNESKGSFINKGKSGNWKDHLNDDMIQAFKSWEEKWMKDTDLKFVYEV